MKDEITGIEMLYGKNPVFEAIRGFRKVFEVFGTKQSLNWLRKELRDNGIFVNFRFSTADKQRLHNLCGHSDHQGLVASAEQFKYTSLRTILSRKPQIILIAAGITDVHNLGAIIRTAHLCGAGAVIIPERNSARIIL